MAGEISADTAAMAHADLLSLRVSSCSPTSPLPQGCGSCGRNVTAYDGWYVALVESLNAKLATLDLWLAKATGPRCAFVIP
jgi:predicted nucleic acid-binding protein